MNYNLLKSRTFWTIILMFVVGGGNAILPVIPPMYQILIQGILGVAAAYFHLGAVVKAGSTQPV